MNKNKKPEVQAPVATPAVKTLDQLIEILDQDELRNVVGGNTLRPKGRA